MRFSTVVTRTAPATAGKVTIGSDAINLYKVRQTVTIVGGSAVTDATDPKYGCIHVSRLVNVYGRPVQRIAVGFVPPAVGVYPAGNLTGVLYILEEATGTWLQCPTNSDTPLGYTMTFVPNQLQWFDVPCTMDFANVNSNDPGKLIAFLDVSTSGIGSLPTGDYLFALGSDISNPGM